VASAALAIVVLLLTAFAVNVGLGMRAHARTDGTISGLGLRGPVTILRDDRGVPHIAAQNDRDMFFAQGYVEASDRLFQMDLLRRFTLGELAEVFGGSALVQDERARNVPVRAIAAGQWRRLGAESKAYFQAFSDGANAAMQREPLPVEFRILAYRPRLWTPLDSLAVGMATVLDLTDNWNDIEPRDSAYRRGGLASLDALFPLTDPCYDAPVTAGLAGMAAGPRCKRSDEKLVAALSNLRAPVGSNAWAVGAGRARDGRALLANDPHLALGIPGVWYLVDLRAPDFRATGATLPGSPGVVLGHNENVAWGATDGTVTSLSAFLPPQHLDPRFWQTETFRVRFHSNVNRRYYRTARDFGVTTRKGAFVLVRWQAYYAPLSPAQAFLDLDRSTSIDSAMRAMAKYPGPTMNFALADSRGRAAYVLSGAIPNDPVRARWYHPASDLARTFPSIPFSRLPKVAASRDAAVWTANNKMYPGIFPLPLSPQFTPPYRAYRIAQLLRAKRRYDVGYFTQMQMDVLSLPERELAHDVALAADKRDASLGAELAKWDGEMNGTSSTASLVEALRVQMTQHHTGRMPTVLARAGRSDSIGGAMLPSPEPWSVAGADPVRHALSSLGITFLDGVTLPGNGDAFTLHMQSPGYSQSFRAVWDVGNWDAGGITLPQGESGEPGSDHYVDQAQAWIAGRLWPLPFSDDAVTRTAASRELLLP
jgi:penicillin G amidase